MGARPIQRLAKPLGFLQRCGIADGSTTVVATLTGGHPRQAHYPRATLTRSLPLLRQRGDQRPQRNRRRAPIEAEGLGAGIHHVAVSRTDIVAADLESL